jgi:excisionase family DNA binding protein
VAFRRKA